MSADAGVVVHGPAAWRDGLARRARALLLLSALCSLLGLFGALHWALELFSHFLVWQGLLSLVAFALLTHSRAKRVAALAAAIAFLQLLPALSWYWPAASARGPANCRLLLANVLTTNPSKEALLRLVEETDPDVILLQETDGRWLEALKTLEARYPLHSAVPRSDNFGIALYSRLPGSLDGVLFQQEHHLPALAATIKVNDRAVSILNLHTLPPVTGPMAFRRDAQLRSGRAWLESRPGPAILAGDLNLTHYSPIYRRLVRGLNARNARAGFGPIGTWPRWLPIAKLPLDHCLVRGDIDVVNCRVGSDIGSDHLPVIVDLHIPAHESSRHF